MDIAHEQRVAELLADLEGFPLSARQAELILMRSSYEFEIPNNFVAFESIDLTQEDLNLARTSPPVIWSELRDIFPINAAFDDATVFFYTRSFQIPPFVINFFLDRISAPVPNTVTKRFFKVMRLINVLRRMVKDYPGYGGKFL